MINRLLSIALLVGLSTGVTRADGATVTLDLSQAVNPASFPLASNGVWTGTYGNGYPHLSFNNNVFSLTHLVDLDGFGSENEWGYWDGFTYSCNGDNSNYGSGVSQSWVARQFGNMAGGGIKTDAHGNVIRNSSGKVMADPGLPYLVAYWGYYKILFGSSDKQTLQVNLNKVYRAEGVYINNSPWPFYGNSGGDSFARPLDRDGDYFKLIVHGLDGNLSDNGRSVEYYLARNIGGALVQSPDWEWVDLSALGEIGGIYFTMESTDNDPVVGINTAAYFCMDKLTVSVPLSSAGVTGVRLNHAAAILNAGETLQLSATVEPSNAADQSLSWTSADSRIASVAANGLVTALSPGSTLVTVQTSDGGYTASCSITVSDSPPDGSQPVTGVRLNQTAATLAVGNILQLAATVEPSDAANRNVIWTSDNESVAAVFSDGQVMALSPGSALITAKTSDGGYTSSCAVTVVNPTGTIKLAARPAVYPNPFAEYIMVEATRGCDATIYDTAGRIRLKARLAAGVNRIDASGLPKGVYVLRWGDGVVKAVKLK
jgi:hypothetical protein